MLANELVGRKTLSAVDMLITAVTGSYLSTAPLVADALAKGDPDIYAGKLMVACRKAERDPAASARPEAIKLFGAWRGGPEAKANVLAAARAL